jgi:hypothetical protein
MKNRRTRMNVISITELTTQARMMLRGTRECTLLTSSPDYVLVSTYDSTKGAQGVGLLM